MKATDIVVADKPLHVESDRLKANDKKCGEQFDYRKMHIEVRPGWMGIDNPLLKLAARELTQRTKSRLRTDNQPKRSTYSRQALDAALRTIDSEVVESDVDEIVSTIQEAEKSHAHDGVSRFRRVGYFRSAIVI